MNLTERIDGFTKFGNRIADLTAAETEAICQRTVVENPWFTKENVTLALKGISKFLSKEKLTSWVADYSVENNSPKNIGVAMAGNIPLVGFHDLLCVLISGHNLHAKLSHQDTYLLNWVRENLVAIDPRFEKQILFRERLTNVDAVIATGSDNTSRYFEYYFRNIPHIIRKNRSSCAVIIGEESRSELELLAIDIFSYFGLGCRNVSKLYVPEGYDFSTLISAFDRFEYVGNHHKYMNNYDYQKSILIVNSIPFLDSGFSLLRESEPLVSPLSVLFYEYYQDQKDLQQKIKANEPKLQCVSSANGWYHQSVRFGETQFPELSNYADGIDTLKFLEAV